MTMRQRSIWARRLVRDKRGSTAVIMAMALIPLLALVGSGLDIARAYTVQARLQQACDAAALAGRRVMLADAIDDKVRTETNKFLNFNFPQGLYGTSTVTPAITRPKAGTVQVEANTSVPTVLMQVFGYRDMPVRVTCEASQTFLNIDIVMVLDNTGSMSEAIAGGSTKLQALRDAVMAFYKQLKPVQDELEANGYRLRYSFVPFSQAVNVGKLVYAQKSSYLRATAPYFRIVSAVYNNGDYDVTWATPSVTHNAGWFSSAAWNGCLEERATVASAATTPTDAEFAQMKDLDIDLVPTSDPDTQWLPADPDPVVKSNYSSLIACPAEAKRLTTWAETDMQTYVNGLQPTGGTYLDIGMIWGARMISGGGIFADSPFSYNGMRTYRYMVFLTDGDMDPAPGAYTGYGFEVVQRRIKGGTAPNPISGFFKTANNLDNADLKSRHEARFDMLCQKVRNDLDTKIWTIKISDKAMDTHLENCANAGQSFTVSDRQKLLDKFAEIGKAITELRISK